MCIQFNVLHFRKPQVAAMNARLYSVYSPDFIEPIVKKEDQMKLKESGEFKELAHRKIKAAKTNVSSSSLQDPIVNKFINYIMEGGKKDLARQILEKGFQNMKRMQLERYHLAKTDEEKETIELNPRLLLRQAIENCRPLILLKKIKRGGTNYKVPIPITEKRSYFMAMKWLMEAANDKPQTVHFPDKIAWELIDAANNTGRVVKRKHDLHKECEANRAYAHFRWMR